jgi:hypothetical protein
MHVRTLSAILGKLRPEPVREPSAQGVCSDVERQIRETRLGEVSTAAHPMTLRAAHTGILLEQLVLGSIKQRQDETIEEPPSPLQRAKIDGLKENVNLGDF